MRLRLHFSFLSVVYLVEGGRMGRKRRRERKRRKAGRSILAGKTFEVLFRETIMEEGERCQLS